MRIKNNTKVQKFIGLPANTRIQMKICYIIFFISFGYTNVHTLNAQNPTNPYYKCIVGNYLNSPNLKQVIEENGFKPTMYNYTQSNVVIDGLNSAENGLISRLVISGEKLEARPSSWGIKNSYDAMRRGNKYQYKHPSDDLWDAGVWVEVEDLKIYAEYKAQRPFEGSSKWVRKLESIILSGNSDKCKDCMTNEKPAEVWPYFLGKDGENLCNWLINNMGKPFDFSFLANNFMEVIMEQETGKSPEYKVTGKYEYENEFYKIHPILPGKHFISYDGTTLVRIENDRIMGLVFFPQIIPTPVFPSIDTSISGFEVGEMYECEKSKYSRYKILKTNDFDITFNYQNTSKISSICIDLNKSEIELADVSQFPFDKNVRPKSAMKIVITDEMRNLPYNETPSLEVPKEISDLFADYLFSNYLFELTENMEASLTMNVMDGKEYGYVIMKENGVENVEFELIDTRRSSKLTSEFAENEKMSLSNFYNSSENIIYGKLVIKNKKSADKYKPYKLRLFVFEKDLDSEQYSNLLIPEQYKHELDSLKYKEGIVHSVKYIPSERPVLEYPVSLYAYAKNFIIVVADENAKDLRMDLVGWDNTDYYGTAPIQPDKSANYIGVDNSSNNFLDARIRISFKNVENENNPIRLKIFCFYSHD